MYKFTTNLDKNLMSQITDLKQELWNIANNLRGLMNADEFRNYMLGFVFYKYLSEKVEQKANELLKPDNLTIDYLNEKEHILYIDALKTQITSSEGYYLSTTQRFNYLCAKGNNELEGDNNILQDLKDVFAHIENSTKGTESEDDFAGLFDDIDLDSNKLGKTFNDRNETVAKILKNLNDHSFINEAGESDLLGDAYEYLISKFASGAGKSAGEFYTPQQVSMILSKIAVGDRRDIKSVYDPTCGSGSLLIRAAKQVDSIGGIYGQEKNPTTFNLSRMNMIMHGVRYNKFDIRHGDTLDRPEFVEEMKFDAIVANPPFSAHWNPEAKKTDERFSEYGAMAPKTKADFAFVQHMVYHLSENGTAATVLPHGVLFRGSGEKTIRKYLIDELNCLDAIIGLPANLFFGTGIPTCIMVLKKCRPENEPILFIDASKEFEKVKTQNMLNAEHIDKIIDTYNNREVKDKYSYLAELAEIRENDYNLNIPRYVDTFEEEEPIDLDAVADEIVIINAKIAESEKKMAKYCQELGIKNPF